MAPGTELGLPALLLHMAAAAQHLVEIMDFISDMLEPEIGLGAFEEQVVFQFGPTALRFRLLAIFPVRGCTAVGLGL